MKILKLLTFIALILWNYSVLAVEVPPIYNKTQLAALDSDELADWRRSVAKYLLDPSVDADEKADFKRDLARALKGEASSGAQAKSSMPTTTGATIAALIKNRIELWNAAAVSYKWTGWAVTDPFNHLVQKQRELLAHLSSLNAKKAISNKQLYEQTCKYFAHRDKAAKQTVQDLLKDTAIWDAAADIAEAKMKEYNDAIKAFQKDSKYAYQVEKIKCIKQMIYNAVNEKSKGIVSHLTTAKLAYLGELTNEPAGIPEADYQS